MRHWYHPLFALLAAQSPEVTRVTISLEELAALAAVAIPDSAYARAYWWRLTPGTIRHRLRAAGWQVERMHEGIHATITFVRLPPDTTP